MEKEDIENPVKLVDQIITIGLANQKKNERNKADVVITPDLDNFIKTEFSARLSLAAGYKAAQKHGSYTIHSQLKYQASSKKLLPFPNHP